MGAAPRIGLVGCGYWGSRLARTLAGAGALAAVSDADGEAARRESEQYNVPILSFESLLEDGSVEALAIATPAATHAQLAEAALRAGKHAFVEKPLALHLYDAERLCTIAEETQKILMVGHVMQYHAAFMKMKELVQNGLIGRLDYVYSHRLNFGRIRREEDILWSFAPHDISMLLALVQDKPSTVRCVSSNYVQRAIADVTVTHVRFHSGQTGHIFVSWLHPYKEQRLVAIGQEGMLAFDDTEPWPSKLQLFRHKISWRDGIPQAVPAQGTPIDVTPSEPLADEIEHLCECIVSGGRPRTDGAEAIGVLRVLDAATRSMMKEGALVSPETSGQSSGIDEGSDDPMAIHSVKFPHEQVAPSAFVHPSAYIDPGCEIGAGTKVWHFSHVLSGSCIGRDCTLGQNVVIGPDVNIGANCKIQNDVNVFKGVTLEDGVFCGPGAVFTNVAHPRSTIDRHDEFLPTMVHRGATIGANATIVCGNEIGEFAFVAAGAVVTRDVPPFALMVGVPARRAGWVSHDGEPLGPDLQCPRSGRRYREVDGDRLEEIT